MTSSAAQDPRAPIRWRPDRAVAVSPDGEEVWQFGGAGPVRLAGRGAGPLALQIDGRHTMDEVVARAVAAGMPAEDARRTIRRWRDAGHVVAASSEPARPAVRVVDRTEPAAGSAAPDLGEDAARLAAALRLAGVDVDVEPEGGPDDGSAPPALTAVVIDDLLAVRRSVEGLAAPLLAVQLRGDRPLVSPLLQADASCPACLEHRMRVRRSMELVAAARVGRELPPASPVRHEPAILLAAGVVAAVARALSGAVPFGGSPGVRPPREVHRRHLAVIDPRSGRVEHHELVPVAACPACDPGGKSVAASHLEGPPPGSEEARAGAGGAGPHPVEAAVRGDGAFRVEDPYATWERHARLVGDVVGLVPHVSPTGAAALRAFSAGANVAAAGDLVLLRSKLRSASGGKGLTLTAARTGALAEALERDTLRARGGEPYRRGRMADLEGAIHPNDVQLFSERQLHRAEQLAALGLEQDTGPKGFHRVPARFDPGAEHDWSPVANLRTGALRWMLSSLVWFAWPRQGPDQPQGSSNGAAAGNTLEEALLQGLLELVERDSVALWWLPRCRRPAIDLAAWDDPRVEAALSPQRALGTDVWVLDVTTDLGIPAAVAVAVGVEPVPRAPLLGFGAHLDPVIAVVRALTELAQMQAPLTTLAPGTPLELPGPAERSWFAEVTPESEPWLSPSGLIAPARSPRYASLQEALEDLVARLSDRGLDLLWADCTRPDIGLPVVRTWAPGLRHFWNRFAPGRLYNVPPAIGWCPPGYGEDDLNPRGLIL